VSPVPFFPLFAHLLFLLQILKELHAQCAPTDDGADVDSSKGTTQLEVYALEIQMYGELKNNKKLRVRSFPPSLLSLLRVLRLWLAL
jgi:hypothetical protein